MAALQRNQATLASCPRSRLPMTTPASAAPTAPAYVAPTALLCGNVAIALDPSCDADRPVVDLLIAAAKVVRPTACCRPGSPLLPWSHTS